MLANRHEPELVTYDRYGHRVDEVTFHPSWHWLMERGVGYGLQAAPWTSDAPHAHLRRAAGFFAWSQTEPGHGCPISMTYAAVPALRADKAIAEEWTPRLASTSYDFGLRAPQDKAGSLAGMGMTEKQGGSDVRANVTTATPTSADGEYTLDGHKWFTSAPMNDVFLVLAQARGRPLLLRGAAGPRRRQPQPPRRRTAQGQAGEPVERVLGAGAPRHLGAAARRGGPGGAHDHRDGGGDPARLRARVRVADAPGAGGGVLARRAPLGLRRAAGRQAADAERGRRPRRGVRGRHRAGDAARSGGRRRRRPARGGAATDRAAAGEVLGLQAHPDDGRRGAGVPGRQRLRRGVGDAAAVPRVAAELDLGGLGERQRPRRAAGAVPRAGGAERLDRRGGPGPRRRPAPRPGRSRSVLESLADVASLEVGARRLAGQMAACLQGALLVQHAPAAVADAFCATRLGTGYGGTLGTLPRGIDLASIVARTTPVV